MNWTEQRRRRLEAIRLEFWRTLELYKDDVIGAALVEIDRQKAIIDQQTAALRGFPGRSVSETEWYEWIDAKRDALALVEDKS